MDDQEIELKFSLAAGDAARLRAHPLLAPSSDAPPDGPDDGGDRLVSTYYDTEAQALRAAGVSLRLRQVDGRRVQTVKSLDGEGLFGRGEWEHEVDGEGLDLHATAGTPLDRVLNGDAEDALKPMFVTRVTRRSRRIRHGDADIEVSLDEGEVEGGDRRLALNELELELKAGQPAALFDVAEALAEAGSLRLSFVSKAEAGYALIDAGARRAFKAQSSPVAPGSTAAQAFQAIARAGLTQLTRNEPGVLGSRSPAALHQMRVALRRLRAAIKTFGDVVDDPRRAVVSEGLAWIAGELGDARSLDVFIHETFQPFADQAPDRRGVAAFGRALLAAQDRAYRRAEAAVASARYRRLVLDTAAWCEAGAWLDGPAGAAPVERFAAKALARRRKAMRRRAKALDGGDAHARHKLRIAAKKMRYAAEVFAGLYDRGRAARRRDRLIDRLKLLQDRLGALNDLATAHDTAALALGPAAGPTGSSAAAYAGGLIVGARTAATGDLVKAAKRDYRRLEQAKAYW